MLTETTAKQSAFGLWDDIKYYTTIFFGSLLTKVPIYSIKLKAERWATFQPTKPSSLSRLRSQALRDRIERNQYFRTSDGLTLHGWFLPGSPKKPTILFARGNYGNMNDKEAVLKAFFDYNFNVFIFDYRGYGHSQGKPSEEGVYQDFIAASDYLFELTGIDPSQQIAMGESLGGAVAIQAATERAFKGLILCCTFTSIADVYSVLKEKFSFLKYILASEDTVIQKFSSFKKMDALTCPLLIIQGDRDSIVPLTMSEKLLSQAYNTPIKSLHIIQHGNHDNLFYIAPKEILNRIEERFVTKIESKLCSYASFY